jgi:hypothetical protein
MERRAVFVDRNGFAHIMGVLDPEEHEIKPSIELPHRGETIRAGLVKVTNRMVLYKEFPPQESNTAGFHPSQQ